MKTKFNNDSISKNNKSDLMNTSNIESTDRKMRSSRRMIELVKVDNVVNEKVEELLGKEVYYSLGGYEEVGNFVYTISEREIEKIALGLNYDLVAFKGLNDDYIAGVETEKLADKGPLFQKISKSIEKEDRKEKAGKRSWGIFTAVIFKEMPNENCIKDMEKAGFKITKLMKNPYLK